jgi:hypothetical protein
VESTLSMAGHTMPVYLADDLKAVPQPLRSVDRFEDLNYGAIRRHVRRLPPARA